MPTKTAKTLIVAYDVTHLTPSEIDLLIGEAEAQAEATDRDYDEATDSGHLGKPDTSVVSFTEAFPLSAVAGVVEVGAEGVDDWTERGAAPDPDWQPVERTGEVLVHLNVDPDWHPMLNADEVADRILAAIERGLGLPTGILASGNDAGIACTLSEEV